MVFRGIEAISSAVKEAAVVEVGTWGIICSVGTAGRALRAVAAGGGACVVGVGR